MSNVAVTNFVVVCAVVFGLAAFVWLVAVPAVQSYERTWERVAEAFLSLYVLLAFVGVGVLAGVAVSVCLWPRLFWCAPRPTSAPSTPSRTSRRRSSPGRCCRRWPARRRA